MGIERGALVIVSQSSYSGTRGEVFRGFARVLTVGRITSRVPQSGRKDRWQVAAALGELPQRNCKRAVLNLLGLFHDSLARPPR